MNMIWSDRYAARTLRMRSSAIRELLKLTESPDLISFAGGLPAPEAFPIQPFAAAAQHVLECYGPKSLQYSTTEGFSKLREMIARHTARFGIRVGPKNILITNGSQQALDLIGRVFLDPGDRVVVDRPTYLGALQAWSAYEAHYLGVPMDEDGMQIPPLEAAIRQKPKFVYALPNFQNPTGVTMTLQRRHMLVELADRYQVPIVEDDPYGQLRYSGNHLPSLAVLDARNRWSDPDRSNVIYLSTFSKILAPGLRLGWLVAPREVIDRLVQAKQGTDLHTSTFVQMVAYEMAREGFLDRHIRSLRSLYRVRRDAMIDALKRHMPLDVHWINPQGGLFIWLTLPEHIQAVDLLNEAVQQKVAFVPGSVFFDNGQGHNTMRLNFSNAVPPQIEEGIGRLGKFLRKVIQPNPA